jgi:hypothetical protein
LGLFFLFKQHKQIPVFLSTLIALCLVVPYLSPSFGLHFTIRNVLKIQEGASEWSHNRPVLEDGLLQLILLIFIASIMAVLIHSYPRLKSRQIDPKTFIFLILLIGFLPISINRVDYQHALMIAWPTFMLWVHLFSKSFPMKSIEKLFYAGPIIGVGVLAGFSLRGGNHLYLIILALLLFALLLIYFSVSKRISDLLSKFLLPFLIISYSVLSFQPSASTFNGLIAKSDWQRVTPEIRWAATKVKLSNSSCLFDFTNQGLIAGLTLIPNCSQYAYPIYTPRPDDKELRNELIKSSPRTLVLSSNFWSYSIDGLTMPERYPLTSAYLATKYRSTECFKGTCVANLK